MRESIENQMVVGNKHDSSKREYDYVCDTCEGEIYHGMTYARIVISNGDHVHVCEGCISLKTA